MLSYPVAAVSWPAAAVPVAAVPGPAAGAGPSYTLTAEVSSTTSISVDLNIFCIILSITVYNGEHY